MISLRTSKFAATLYLCNMLITTDLAPLIFTSALLTAAIPWREIVRPEKCGGTSFPP